MSTYDNFGLEVFLVRHNNHHMSQPKWWSVHTLRSRLSEVDIQLRFIWQSANPYKDYLKTFEHIIFTSKYLAPSQWFMNFHCFCMSVQILLLKNGKNVQTYYILGVKIYHFHHLIQSRIWCFYIDVRILWLLRKIKETFYAIPKNRASLGIY